MYGGAHAKPSARPGPVYRGGYRNVHRSGDAAVPVLVEKEVKKPPMQKIDMAGADWHVRLFMAVERGESVTLMQEGKAIARALPEALCHDMERRQREQDLAIVVLDDAFARLSEVILSHPH